MSIEWVLIRGSGVAAFALLSAATIWGLLVSSKLLGRIVKAKPLTWFHESLGIGALLATVVHVVVLSIHDFLEFSWIEILVPGVSDWRPLPTAFGVVSLYALIVVIGSFYLKRFIGQKVWRSIHFISFGLFISALLHGMLSGTDTNSPLMLGLYAGSAIAVFALVGQRLTLDHPGARPTESARANVPTNP
jgi:predicted ferric reductase